MAVTPQNTLIGTPDCKEFSKRKDNLVAGMT